MQSLTAMMESLKEMWNEQSNQMKYLIIATASMPSFMLLRNIYWFIHRQYNRLPPGPNGLPLIGIALKWHSGTKDRINLAKQYGPIIYTSYFGFPYVILSSSKLVKEILTQKQFLNRNAEELYLAENVYQPSIFTVGKSQAMNLIMIDGDSWMKRRKLTNMTLFKTLNNKNVSNVLKQTFEVDVKQYLDNIISSNNGQWTDTKEIFQYITLSTIYMAIFGRKLDRNSKLFQTVKNNINDTMQSLIIDNLVITIPFLKYFYGEKLLQLRSRRDEELLGLVNDTVNSKNNDEEKSYIDYIHDMVRNGELTQDEEIADLMVLFIAGMDTTSNTLQFGVTLLAKYPDIQDKVRKELLDIMGKEYNISLINKCPIFRAAVHEILRISSTPFMSVERGSKHDYWLTMDDGTRYKIPKDCAIMTNVDYIHIARDTEEIWKKVNGDEIILENFLIKDESNGEMKFIKNKSFIPFGVGKRDCVGRQLAMKELYYTLGYLLMNYTISYTNDKDRSKDITLMREASAQTACLNPVISITIAKV